MNTCTRPGSIQYSYICGAWNIVFSATELIAGLQAEARGLSAESSRALRSTQPAEQETHRKRRTSSCFSAMCCRATRRTSRAVRSRSFAP